VRSTHVCLVFGLLSVGMLCAFWAVRAQEETVWTPPPVLPTTTEPVAEKKAPIKIGAQPFNEKPTAADPSMIIPAAAYEKPQIIRRESPPEILQTGGVVKVEEGKQDEKAPSLPALPGLIPELPDSKTLVLPELPAPLPPPMVEPTKVLITDPPVKELPKKEATPLPVKEIPKQESAPLPAKEIPKKELPPLPPTVLMPSPSVPIEEKKELFPTPKLIMEPKQDPIARPAPVEPKQPATLIAPALQAEEKVKAFVRVRSDKSVIPPPSPIPEPGPAPGPPPPVPASGSQLLTLQTPSLTLEKRGMATPGRDDVHNYQIVIRNVGSVPGQQVRVEDELPSGAKLISGEPTPTLQGGRVSWLIPEIPGQREIVLQMAVQSAAPLVSRHHTSVTFAAVSQTHLAATPVRHDANAVVRPDANALAIQLIGPWKGTVGKPVVLQIRVANQSARPISGIKLFGNLPEGLNTPEGRNIEGPEDGLVFQPGETKTLKMPVDAVKVGRQVVRVKVATGNGIEAVDSGSIDITADTLSIQQAPSVKLLPGRDGDLRVDITNHSGRTLRNVSVVNRLAEGLEFVAASERGLYQANSRSVYWSIKELPDAQTLTLQVRVHGTKSGQFANVVTAKADGIAEQTSNSVVLLEGMADLTLKVIDRDNPAYLGREVNYEIHVHNRGMSADRNVQLQVQFPPGMMPKTAQGPMRHTLSKQSVVFDPIVTVGPQGQAIFRVSAIAQAQGDQRVRFAIVSDQVRNPIQREISTMVYRD
jgi:uncharacterized repeat protein (TIGR01451 family)